jgi:hypothetical protein
VFFKKVIRGVIKLNEVLELTKGLIICALKYLDIRLYQQYKEEKQ